MKAMGLRLVPFGQDIAPEMAHLLFESRIGKR